MTAFGSADAARQGRLRLSTGDVSARERGSWLREVIGREYADVEICPPAGGGLFNEMTIYPWDGLQLSAIRSSAIAIERLANEPRSIPQDAYFAVILLAGRYSLEQDGRETFLRPGDMAIYDATRPHRIRCPRDFSKLIVSIPRATLEERVAGVERCTARRIAGGDGIGGVAAGLIRSSAGQVDRLSPHEFSALASPSLDLLALAAASVRPAAGNLPRSRIRLLNRAKAFIERHLSDPGLNAGAIAAGVGVSPRYLNTLFQAEQTSLMRYVWQRRVERCRTDMLAETHAGRSLSEIAFRWGFNDPSHFSRLFRLRFGCAPREYRGGGMNEAELGDD